MLDSVSALLTAPAPQFAATVTAALFLAFPPFLQYAETGTFAELLGRLYRVLLVGGVMFEAVRTHAAFWVLVALIHFIWIANAYALADNHRYLEGYWCCALAAALYAGDSRGNFILVRNAFALLGLPFLLSVLWKLSSHTYRNGSFFVYQLLADPRFAALSHLMGERTAGLMASAGTAIRIVRLGRSDSESIAIPTSLRRLSLMLTWWTIAIEAAIAIAFLIPVTQLRTWQLVPVLIFAVTTYVLVPITTFSNILLVMLAASTPNETWRAIILTVLAALSIIMFLGSFFASSYERNYRRFLDTISDDRSAHSATQMTTSTM